MNYYNEIDPYCAAWLQNLMDAGHIAPGVIDTRSIEDVRPDELAGYTQCHFFAGLGGWAYALDLAGWPRDRPVWTGSCPCQPFSAAGKGNGFADQRHLWPSWFHLIREREPAVIFGEQVEGPAARVWLDLVQADMESVGYAFGGGRSSCCERRRSPAPASDMVCGRRRRRATGRVRAARATGSGAAGMGGSTWRTCATRSWILAARTSCGRPHSAAH